MLKEFKAFALKGNIVDLAIAVIIGTAFGKIVTSLVNDLLMPAFGAAMGGLNLSGLEYQFGNSVLKYGAFLQSVIDFAIIAFSLFVLTRLLIKLKQKEATKEPEPKAHVPSEEEKLLAEIRDLLKPGHPKG